jgi:hypothetical protein
VPGLEEGIFEEERKQENIYDESLELQSEIFYDWDFDLKIWLNDAKMLYSNSAEGIRLFEESSYLWSNEKSEWEGNNKVEYFSEYNYFSEYIQNWKFMELYLPAFSFNGVVCDKIEYTNWENNEWAYSGTYNYYFSENPVGIETLNKVEISFYPNPVLNFLTIKTKNLLETTCTIRDLNGRICSQNNFQTATQIDLSYLSPGIYFVEFYSERERIYVDKIIKN